MRRHSPGAETVTLYRAANALEAHLLQGMLAQHGIRAALAGERLAAGVGELPANVLEVELRVARRDLEAARRLIAAYEARAAAGDAQPGWRCSACGEHNPDPFDICWKCSAPRDAPP